MQRRKSRSENRTKYDVVLFKNFIRAHSGGTDVPSESPPLREIEKSKVNTNLKVPFINQFNDYTDPSDFVQLFDSGERARIRCARNANQTKTIKL